MSDETLAQNDNAADKAKSTTSESKTSEPEVAAAETAEAEVTPEQADAFTAADVAADLAQKNAELNDKMLRMAAEMDNTRKRFERELVDTRTYAIAGFARDMLTATDSLSRALMTLPAEARETADTSLKSLIDGIELTEREMQRLLAKHGVKPIDAEGTKFDPHKHQAMFEVPDPNVPEGTVVQVVQAGFSIGDRVLRPAMVGVAKGGPKAGQKDGAEHPPDGGIDKSV